MTEAPHRLDRSLAQARHWISIDRPEKTLDALADAGPGAAEEPAVFLLTALAHLQMDALERAGQAAARGLALEPENPFLLEVLGLVSWRKGDRPAAERAFLGGLKAAPEDPHLLARYALLTGEAGQLDKARRLAERAAAVAPLDPLVTEVRSLLAYMEGDDEKAKELGAAALAEAPEDSRLHALMGSYLLQGGAFARATEHHLTSAAMNPEDEDARILGRQAKYIRHPLMRPMWFVERVGPGKIWIAWIVILIGLRSADLDGVAGVATIVYLSFALYTWVVPPILRKRYGIEQ